MKIPDSFCVDLELRSPFISDDLRRYFTKAVEKSYSGELPEKYRKFPLKLSFSRGERSIRGRDFTAVRWQRGGWYEKGRVVIFFAVGKIWPQE